ncbi:IPTL-CTERM sorting domain-containing protein [Ottowia sp.]|uniref:IPTL-CTERM sorting domain-containing protein n=1 Tax=Ottowia sp. TaxID=1898956 RepID=UPI00260E0F48|nr:IPTL-CTERM sorting domain-containing protein [Ottowia sp.]
MHIPFFPHRARRGIAAALGSAALACTVPAHAAVVGNGTLGSCTEAALDSALSGGGIVTFDCGEPATTIVLSGPKVLTAATTIDGGGKITLTAGGAFRLFQLNNAAYTFTGLSLTNGQAVGVLAPEDKYGGAIYASGSTLLLDKVTLTGNVAEISGGAIFASSSANVTLSEVTATGNRAGVGGVIGTGTGVTLLVSELVAQGNHGTDGGGAIWHRGVALTVQLSLFTGNTVDDTYGSGGAIFVTSTATTTLAIANSTFQGNGRTAGGAPTFASALGVANVPSGTVTNSTFVDNVAAIFSGVGSTLTLKNTIVSSSTAAANCVTDSGGAIADGGNNLQYGGTAAQSCGASIPDQNPQLAALANNGGFSQTMALLAGSPAIDAGSGCPATDQRGVARPIGPACDIGAFEAPLPVVVPPGPGGQAAAIPALDGIGLALLSALVAGMGLLRRRKQSAE